MEKRVHIDNFIFNLCDHVHLPFLEGLYKLGCTQVKCFRLYLLPPATLLEALFAERCSRGLHHPPKRNTAIAHSEPCLTSFINLMSLVCSAAAKSKGFSPNVAQLKTMWLVTGQRALPLLDLQAANLVSKGEQDLTFQSIVGRKE